MRSVKQNRHECYEPNTSTSAISCSRYYQGQISNYVDVTTFSSPESAIHLVSAMVETSGRLQFSDRDSRTSDLSAQSHAFIKMEDQAINFAQEI